MGTTDATDINGDGAVDAGDFTIFAGNYGSLDCHEAGDLNLDGAVNAADFTVLAGKYGTTGIPACGTESLMSGSSGFGDLTPALEAMGFESIEDFGSWLDEQSEEDQLDALLELLSLLEQ